MGSLRLTAEDCTKKRIGAGFRKWELASAKEINNVVVVGPRLP